MPTSISAVFTPAASAAAAAAARSAARCRASVQLQARTVQPGDRRSATRSSPVRLRASADGQEPGSTNGGSAEQQPSQGQPPLSQQQTASSQQQPQQQAAPQASQQAPLDDNVWAYKPLWCQPATILATGGAFVAGVWAISGHSAGWSVAAALPVAAWWYLFLIVYPAQFREYVVGVRAQQEREGRQRQGQR